jgi:DnaK suppressor protein
MSEGPDLAETEARLRARLAEVDAEIAELTKPPERGGTISFGKRVGEGTTQAIGRFTDVGIVNELEAIRARVRRGLEKIAEGSYGVCDVCGEQIALGRLKAAPESALCIKDARNTR